MIRSKIMNDDQSTIFATAKSTQAVVPIKPLQ